MKRTPLKPSRVPLARSPIQRQGKPLQRTGRLRFRSVKVERMYRQLRRGLVADLLGARPICQRCDACPSTEVHEIKSRARGGSITDVTNCVALCHRCHDWVTTHPALAAREGWLKQSWEA